MAKAFATWHDRVTEAQDEHAQRALLGEIGLWRAGRLTDVVAQRQATWALAELYRRLGNEAQAQLEAEQLVALCRTAPAARGPEVSVAERLLRRVKGTDKKRASESWDKAKALAARGDWDGARRATRGKGIKPALFRVWTSLEEALGQEGDAREEALRALADRLAERVGARDEAVPVDDAVEPTEAAPPADDSPLAVLLGGPVPRRRRALLDAMARLWASDEVSHDAVAAAALHTHVAQRGPKAVAPWYIGFVARAMAEGDAPETRAAIAALGDAHAVTAYAEPAFEAIVSLLSAASEADWTIDDVRRGISSRGPTAACTVWTVRLSNAAGQILVARPAAEAPWTEAQCAGVMARLAELSPRVVLWAPGDEHAALRGGAGDTVVVDSTDPAEVVSALATVPAAPASVTAPTVADATPVAPAAAAPADARPSDDASLAEVATLFAATPPSAAEAYATPLAGVRRAFKAFVAVRDQVASAAGDDLDARLAPLLRAVHAAAPAHVHLAEGTSMAIRAACAAPDGAVEAILRAGDALATRYGGAAGVAMLPMLRAAAEDGWQVDRVLTGATRGEARVVPGLAPIRTAIQGLYRVTLRRAEATSEVWWLDGPSPEALAAVAMLAAHRAPAAWATAPGTAAPAGAPASTRVLAWTDDAAPALREALSAAGA